MVQSSSEADSFSASHVKYLSLVHMSSARAPPHLIDLSLISVVSFHLRVCHPAGFFPVSPPELSVHVSTPSCAAAHLVLIRSLFLVTFGYEYNSRS